MIDSIGCVDKSHSNASLNFREQSPILPQKHPYDSHSNRNFSKRQRSQNAVQDRCGPYMSGGYNSCSKNTFTIDKEFLTKLEISLKKLTKSNERIQQIMREKEEFEKQCIRLKQKIKRMKDEKQNCMAERECLIAQNNKMEFKLKQA